SFQEKATCKTHAKQFTFFDVMRQLLVDWEKDGPKITNPETGEGVQRYKRFEPYGPPLGGGLA
ncbi:hypothetical protein, partial [Gimesia sp.]|uniref:hypothetical protein n=1 Tax=Gimesia sp. TaxID=2024833 RepID=UPI003A9343AC